MSSPAWKILFHRVCLTGASVELSDTLKMAAITMPAGGGSLISRPGSPYVILEEPVNVFIQYMQKCIYKHQSG